MGLFTRKPKVGVEDFCREFYDTTIFHAIVAGEDLGLAYLDGVFNSVAEADSSFSAIDQTVFRREMIAVWMELFGLAWVHHLKKDEYTLPQTLFTKNYLEQNERPDIWETMLEYNTAIAMSSTEIVTGERIHRALVTQLNTFRAGKFDKWVEAGVDPECAARVCKRFGCDVAWKRGLTAQRLSARLADRLGCETSLEFEALFRLAAIAHGFYNGAKETIKTVNISL